MNRLLTLITGLAVGVAITLVVIRSMPADTAPAAKRISGYEILARFDNVGHLEVGATVSAAGVQVGQVKAIDYDFEAYEAVVTMVIDKRYDSFPQDSSASILTRGFTGPQYVGLQPGADDRPLRDGDLMDITSSALILEQIIGQFLYNMAQEENNDPRGIAGPAISDPGF